VTYSQCDARPMLTFSAVGHHCPATGTKIRHCLVTEAHVCEQLAQGCYPAVKRPGVELAISYRVALHWVD